VSDAAAAVARRAYASQSFTTRLHVAARWWTCPFRAVARAVPRAGTVLDAGCGHGLFSVYLAAQSPQRRITGVDIDEDKLTIARAAARAAGVDDRVDFRLVTPGWHPDASWDTIVEVDMLYLLGRRRADEWLEQAAGALTPGGQLVVKELDVEPRWKARWSRFQEVLATRVARITEGDALELVPRRAVVAAMADCGLHVDACRLDRTRLHPHYLAIGTRAVG
jgi:cyclopropane fatty-acyl-phospholipid synthase-like methyltransferase